MEPLRKLIIREFSFPVDGHRFNAEIWTSIDGGKSWWYCGIGKCVHTREQAEEYFSEFMKRG